MPVAKVNVSHAMCTYIGMSIVPITEPLSLELELGGGFCRHSPPPIILMEPQALAYAFTERLNM